MGTRFPGRRAVLVEGAATEAREAEPGLAGAALIRSAPSRRQRVLATFFIAQPSASVRASYAAACFPFCGAYEVSFSSWPSA